MSILSNTVIADLDYGSDLLPHLQTYLVTDHSRSLLAQFGLTPKSKRGWGAGEVGDVAVNVLLWNWSRVE